MIEKMWGTCDGHGIVFTQVSNNVWTCDVPADLVDGTYMVEIWAKTHSSYVIYTTAILYMCDSKCVGLKLVNDGFYTIIRTVDYDINILSDTINVCMNDYNVKIMDDSIRVVIL